MKLRELRKGFVNWLAKLFGIIFVLFLIFGCLKFYYNSFKKDKEIRTPVKMYEIDSITKENDNLIIEVNYLDSIKNEKIIEVKSLDNDSTLMLFYKLIRK